MTYNETILNFIQIIDSVLLNCNQQKLLENKDFVIVEDYLNLNNYLVIDLVKYDDLGLRFWFENTILRIDILGIEEAYVFNTEDIKYNKEIEKIIKVIFTHTINIEACGKIYKRISFISPDGQNNVLTNTKHSVLSLLRIKWNCYNRQFSPIYEKCDKLG